MAKQERAVPENVAGEFFVDDSCINCDTCRQLARTVFQDQGQHSAVCKQPESAGELQEAFRALLSCPTASIGTRKLKGAGKVISYFPLPLSAGVFYCGFNSEQSYGANSFFIQHQDGNWLIDSPRFTSHLQKQFQALGGIKYIFLTHRDDIADAQKYSQVFQAQTFIHMGDQDAAPWATDIATGEEPIDLGADFTIIPVPGHTRGHMVLLYRNTYLFTGDHLAYDPETEKLIAFREHCWYSWSEQVRSMERLLDYDFSWVLAGHGDRVELAPEQMKRELKRLIAWMRS